MTDKEKQPFGSWNSPIGADQLTSGVHSLGFLQSADGNLFWTEQRPEEGGRTVLVHFDGTRKNDLIGPPFNVQSKVHEYGGRAYCTNGTDVYFVNGLDQDFYKVSTLEPLDCERLTNSDAKEYFGDPILDEKRKRLICIRERHPSDASVINELVAVHLRDGSVTTLFTGHDFYVLPRLSPNGERLAFVAWDHPNMPWDGTQLYISELSDPELSVTLIAGGADISIGNPLWLSDENLVYTSDASGFWNPYVYDGAGTYLHVEDQAEFAGPMWTFGTEPLAALDENFFMATRNDRNQASLVIVDSNTGLFSPFDGEYLNYTSPVRLNDGVACIVQHKDRFDEIVVIDGQSKSKTRLAVASDIDIDRAYLSVAESISFDNDIGESVYAYFYPPTHPKLEAEVSERPPLLVLAHGGPTGSTSTSLSLKIQYYTSRGWAVLDVDYSGSSGYGKPYRERLRGQWGIRDIEDCAAGVRYLVSQDLIDPMRVAIKGGSAGGYTTLRALTTTTVFKAGASHYGVADIRLLARDTHKFESQYISQLVPEDHMDDRSPVNDISKLDCPVVFFQGAEDRVVPPNQAEMMFEALKAKGLATAIFLFPGEGHGFRRSTTQKQSIEAEYFFFSQVLNFDAAGLTVDCFEGARTAKLSLI